MKIVMVADLYYPLVNGCAIFAQRLARELLDRGHQVIVIAPSESLAYTEQTLDGVTVFGVRSYPLLWFYPKFRVCFSVFYNKYIERIIEQFKPDVIHCQFHFGVNRAVLKVAKRQLIPTVATNHFMPETMVHYVPFSSIIGPMLLRLAWKDFGRVFMRVDNITSPTKIAASLIEPYCVKPVSAISNGIDLMRFKPDQDASHLHQRLGLPNKPVLLYVGRLDKEKNLDWVIQAAAQAMQHVDFQLVIAGKGVLKNALMQLSATLNIAPSVTFTDYISDADLPLLYCLADCFVIAGVAELQSIVTMEAMASGLPVLAVDAVALPELVKSGENGFLFPQHDVQDLANKMTLIFKDEMLRKTMREKSLAFIQTHDIKKIIKQFEQLYIQTITSNYSPRRPERSEGSPASGSMVASGDPSSQAPRDDGRAVTITTRNNGCSNTPVMY